MALVTSPKIIGMPPGSNSPTDNPMYNSMPTAVIVPGEPVLTPSSQVFKVSSAMKKFTSLLNQNGYNYPSQKGIEVVFLSDNFPTDTFSNQYGASFLEKINDFGSEGIGQLAQFSGETGSIGVIKEYLKGLKGLTQNERVQNIESMLQHTLSSLQTGLNKAKKSGGMTGMLANAADAALAGGRIDFPQVWKGSGFSPSYTMTIRLYNPDPSDRETTNKYIAAPLAVLLTLSLPRVMQNVNGGYLYNWPFFCKISCPGIYFLNPCCISSVSIIKGGDQQSISWNQRLDIVDVRIEFTSLFNSMVVGNGNNSDRSRPNMKSYLDALLGEKKLKKIPRSSLAEGEGGTPELDAGPPLKQYAPTKEDITETSPRTPGSNDMKLGELTKYSDQAKSFKSFANGIVKAAKDAVKSPAATIRSAVDVVKHYTDIYKSATTIVGNVKTFDKENILSSIYGVEESIVQFENEIAYPDQLESARYILGETQELKRQTDRTKAIILSI